MQVTNPPIDPLREGLVMSLEMRLGKRGNLLTPGPDSYAQLLLKSPVLLESELAAVTDTSGLSTRTFRLHYQSGDPGAMEAALRKLCADVEAAVKNGCEVLILSDRLPEGEEHAVECPPIPALLAVGAVHHHLIRTGLRTETSIVADTAQCVSTHQLAVMVGYGAHAVCPYLGFETARQWRSASRTEALIKSGKVADVSITAAQKNYKKALEKGLLKILSKMGISLLSCYHGAQIFEIYGLGKEVVDLAFFGSVSRIGGLSLADAQRESESFWVKVSSCLDHVCCTSRRSNETGCVPHDGTVTVGSAVPVLALVYRSGTCSCCSELAVRAGFPREGVDQAGGLWLHPEPAEGRVPRQ